VRITERVNIALRTGDLPGRHLKDLRLERRVDIAISSNLDLSIATLLDQRRQPADFEITTDEDEQVGLLEFKDETRFRLDEVRILVSPGNRIDSNAIPADLARDGRKVLGRCHDIQLALRCQRRSRD
jgi:hypothetical protein